MTDEEFERIKQAEKEQLRAKKRLRTMLAVLKRGKRSEGLVERMQRGAQTLLRETESLIETLRGSVARDEARLERAVGDPSDSGSWDERLPDVEEARREKRAERLVREYKAFSRFASSRPSTGADGEEESSSPSSSQGPEKTIGRMKPSPDTDDGG